MRWSKGRLYFLVFAAALYFGWRHLSPDAYETAILHIPPGARSQDTYVNLWVVDDGGSVWLRAESPERLWLTYLQDMPEIDLERAGGTDRYRAMPEDTASTRAHVDALFRQKYGLADQVRALTRSRTVPIGLVRP